jgi:hypothetical protein
LSLTGQNLALDESLGYFQIVPDRTDTSNDVMPSLAAWAMMCIEN